MIIKELNPRKAFLTHISHSMGLYENIAPSLPENVFLGIDGMSVDI